MEFLALTDGDVGLVFLLEMFTKTILHNVTRIAIQS